jgi:hypothetical protein
MSRTHLTPASSSNFQLIFNNALKAYEKQTKKDLLAHPLAAELQACDSPTSVLAVLQRQVQDFNQSRTSNERLTKWLDPTVDVLYAFSGTLGEGVGLVCLEMTRLRCVSHPYFSGFFTSESDLCWSRCSPFGVNSSENFMRPKLTSTILRQRRMSGQAKTLSSTSSNAWSTFSDASKTTPRHLRPQK